ncbi:hypothetical protein L6452_41965 [Arctium lappa]|uniref:Uncharacterized protein n=1 Tax=Arctium lappa TaxID=4217 RepID=A0ACB8XHF1_ARCLA|nr:hypothetical protein L6452_41965 [Arctium lappa]
MDFIGSYWFSGKASKEMDDVTKDISDVPKKIAGGANKMVNSVTGKKQKPLSELLHEYELPAEAIGKRGRAAIGDVMEMGGRWLKKSWEMGGRGLEMSWEMGGRRLKKSQWEGVGNRAVRKPNLAWEHNSSLNTTMWITCMGIHVTWG